MIVLAALDNFIMAPEPSKPVYSGALNGKGKKGPEDDVNDDDVKESSSNAKKSVVSNIQQRLRFTFPCIDQRKFTTSSAFLSGLPDITKLCFRSIAIATITLYVLNQKHMLPKPMGKIVSKVLFWPTIPITVSRRIGKWTTEVDNAVVIGGAPFGFMRYPEKLVRQFNVRGVVNMCDEYRGPVSSYKKLGIEQLRLPTVDHFEPSFEDLKKAVEFIQKYEAEGGRVYVHCRAGHGRSAAAVFAWLLYKEPLADPIDLNEKLCAMRNVRKGLWKQPNINKFRTWLQSGGMVDDDSCESDSDDCKVAFTKTKTSQSLKHHSDETNAYSNRRDRSGDQGLTDLDHLGRVFSDEDFTTTDYDTDYEEDYYQI